MASLSGGLSATLSYDAKGNVLQARGTYGYDGAGHLSHLCIQPKANCASAPDQRFSYDGKGMRVLQEQAGGARTVSFYGQLGLMLEEDLSTGKIKEYIHAGGELIAHDGSDGLLYYHNDHLGSPVAASNAQGALQWRAHFRPYGERQAEGGANVGSIGYTGHVQDAANGLVYAGARYYDPVVGRFLAIDPAEVNPESAISFNRYAYANNSPYRFVDPDGRMSDDAILHGGWTPGFEVHIVNLQGGVGPIGGVQRGLTPQGELVNNGAAKSSGAAKSVTVSKSRFPESAKHIEDAVSAGKPNTLTIDRAATASRRRDSLRGTETKSGLDRDEFPSAMFQEGGRGASVRHVSPSDNRGAGACIGAQCRGLPDGTKVRIDVVD